MRILQIAGDPLSRNGISGFALQMRLALRARGLAVEEYLVPTSASYSWREILAYADAVGVSMRGCDLVHVELGGHTVHEFHAAHRIAELGRMPLFVTAHDPPWAVRSPYLTRATRGTRYLRLAPELVLAPLARRVSHEILERADGVFTLSRRGLEALATTVSDGLRGRSAVLPYAPASVVMAAGAARGRAVDVGARNATTVAFFGHWYAGKGLATLVRALEIVAGDADPVRARLFGDAWPVGGRGSGARYRSAIIRLIAASSARELIETPGWLDGKRLATELSACDAVVLPYELRRPTRALASASAALLDALSTGTPVIASRVRALEEFIIDGDNGLLVPPDDPNALAEALRTLRDDGALRGRLREGARATAAQRSPTAAAEVMVALYEQRLAARGEHPMPSRHAAA